MKHHTLRFEGSILHIDSIATVISFEHALRLDRVFGDSISIHRSEDCEAIWAFFSGLETFLQVRPNALINKSQICEIRYDGDFPVLRLFNKNDSVIGSEEFLEPVRNYAKSIEATEITVGDGAMVNLSYVFQRDYVNRFHRIESKVVPMIEAANKQLPPKDKSGLWK